MQDSPPDIQVKKEFIPVSSLPMNYKLKRIYRKHNNQKIKRWTKEESDLYSKFISEHTNLLQDASVKRAKKIFILMSQYIKTKNPSQCRSHHQKFYRKENSDVSSIENTHNKNINHHIKATHNSLIEKRESNNVLLKKIKIEESFHLQNERKNIETSKKEKIRLNNHKFKIEEEKPHTSDDETIDNLNRLNEKQLDDFIGSAKMLFNVGSQMHKLRKNFEEFENKHLKVFKDSCNFLFISIEKNKFNR